MADNRQQKANGKKPEFNKGAGSKEIITKDGHKTTIIRGEKITVLWKGMEIGPENHPRARVGKTAKDRASGAMRRNQDNKDSRASWCNDGKRSINNFPYNSCNGKKNRTVVTGKGNERITISYKAGSK